jgi:hypothetical protein
VATLESKLGSTLKKDVDLPKDGPSASSQPFVTSDPCPPWALADLPVVFDVNPSSPGTGGPTGSNFARLAYDSWHAWQALNDSYPAFSFGTITSRGQAVDGLHTVGWGNLGSGILGVNHCAWIGDERYDSDTLIDRDSFTWDADDSNGISASAYSLQAVMEHELGHGLSLGHSDQTCNGSASTPLMCPAVANGVRKTILSDDRAGAAFMYDLTGSPPGSVSNLQVTAGDGVNNLSWAAASGTKHAYDIERSSTGCTGSFKSINTVAGNVTTFVDDNYGDGIGTGNWCYRVKAIGTGGDSAAWSNSSSVDLGDPANVSVSPASGTVDAGSANTYVATFTHPGGYEYMQRVDLIVADSQPQGLAGCWVAYRVDLNRLYLRTDSGSFMDAGAPGSGTMRENARCQLLPAQSSVSNNGANLAVSFRLVYKETFDGAHNLILQALEDGTGTWSAPTDEGDVTVATYDPENISVSPSNGSTNAGTAVTLTANFQHDGGYQQIERADLIVAADAPSGLSGCWLVYRVDLNLLYLRSDSGSYLNAGTPGGGGSAQNSKCTLSAAQSSATRTGDNVSVSFRVTFKEGGAGTHNLILQAQEELTNTWNTPSDLGNYTVNGFDPVNVSVTPNSGSVDSGTPVTFSASYSHGGGYSSLERVDLVVGESVENGLAGCWLIYRVDLNRLYLRGDSGSYLSAGTPGSSGSAQNSQCILHAAQSTATANGNNVSVNFRVTFKDAIAGAQNLVLQAQEDDTGLWNTPSDLGNYTVVSHAAENVSVTPATGTATAGTPSTFTAMFTHDQGYQQIERADLIIADSQPAGLDGCWVIYRVDLNRLYIRSDVGGFVDAGAPGTGTTRENSQCILDAAASSVVRSGNDVTVNFVVNFKATMVGSTNLILQAEEEVTFEWNTPEDLGDVTIQ